MASLFFLPLHFFFHLRHRCVFVLLLKILEYEGERVFCGRALTVVLLRLRVKGVEGRSTLRLTMIIKAMNLPFYEPCGGFDFNE